MDLRRILYDETMPSAPLPQAPKLGLLTRTVVHSPVIKSMFPARIRHEDKNDVIIVRENGIELRQLVRDRLRTVAFKCDFDATIRAARVLGEPRRLVSTPNESESDFEENEDIDDADRGSDVEIMDIDSEPLQTLPPQIIALALRSANATRLMFLFAQDDRSGGVVFVSSTLPLPSHENGAGCPDAHIAVDPKSLVLAVAAQNDVVVLYALKARDQLAPEVEQHRISELESFNPVKEQYEIELSATILKMEFLHPPKDIALQGIVLLALVLSAGGQTRIRLFEWDSSQPLREIKAMWDGGYPIPHEVRHLAPSQLITITNNCGFILTFERSMLFYQNLHSNYSAPIRIEYPKNEEQSEKPEVQKLEPPYEFGEAARPRYWTAWARPARTEAFREKHDCLYLGREDGDLSFMNFSESPYFTRHKIGRVNVHIDSGFASLDPGGSAFHNGGYDVLAIAGSSSDGGLFDYKPRAMAHPLPQRLHNWSPVLDWTMLPSDGLDSGSSTHQSGSIDTGRIFACAGHGMKHGKLCEVRRGIEAHCLLESSIDTLGAGLPTRLWLLNTGDQDRTPQLSSLVLSDPGRGTANVTINEANELVPDATNEVLDVLLDPDAETLAVAVTSDHLAVQITTSSIRTVSVRGVSGDRELATREFPSPIVHACIDGRMSTCLICLNGPRGHTVHYINLTQGEEAPRISPLSSLNPEEVNPGVSCMAVCSTTRITLVLVGTTNQQILLYRVDGDGLSRITSHEFKGQSAICESIGFLRPAVGRSTMNEMLILCGLRNGALHILRLNYQDPAPISPFRELRIGHSSVWVLSERSNSAVRGSGPRSAIIACQDVLLKISVNGDSAARTIIHRIWLTDMMPHTKSQGPIFAVGQFESYLGRHRLSRALCCIDEKAVRIMSIDTSRIAGTVPQQIKLDGTPRRVIYAKSIEKLLVAHEQLVMVPSRTSALDKHTSGRQLVFSKLRVVDPEQTIPETQIHDEVVVGLSGDKVTGMLEWMPELNGSRWSLLAVSMIRKKELEGCIYIFRLRGQDGKCSLKLQKEIPRSAPVHSIATFGDTGIVYSCGRRLEIVQLTSSEKGFTWMQPQELQLDLDSPARALSTHGTEIFVSTAAHSHLVCTVTDGKLGVRYTDYKARHGLDNVYLDHGPRLLLGSDTHGGVCGLWRPEEDEERNMRPVFEARLPNPITRLRLSTTPSNIGPGDHPSILGVSIDGSFHSFDVLGTQKWRLLRFVQNLIDRDPRICPATYMENEDRHVEPGTGPSHMHVNGDVLARLFEQIVDGATFIRSLLDMPVRPREYEFESAQQRMDRFQELVREAISDVDMEDPCAQFMSFLNEIIRPTQ